MHIFVEPNRNTMENTVINSSNLNQSDVIKGQEGKFRAVVKVRAGFYTIVENGYWRNVMEVFNGFKKGSLLTIQFQKDGTDHWLTVFAITGKKVVTIDKEILKSVTVGDINQNWSKTNLYNQEQYKRVNAKTWADKAFVMNP